MQLKQIEGFGEYGFPESHAASFAHLVYVSCWLKCHEPAAFTCALLNSQPMGFYSPSEFVQDAERHGIEIRGVDVNRSAHDHTLVRARRSEARAPEQPAIRLGLRLVRGLSAGGIAQVLASRKDGGPFNDARDLVVRGGIDRRDRAALAAAGALVAIEGHRHRAHWSLLGVEALPPLLADAAPEESGTLELPLPTEGEDLVADHRALGLTLGRHPLALLRDALAERRYADADDVRTRRHGQLARVAGLVTMRQRPGSASGTMFVTLEDELGPINVILWPAVVARFRPEAIAARLLGVSGTTQREDGVSHFVAGRLEDLSAMLSQLDSPLLGATSRPR